jgi:eukaryotic-like serine/threonine-protein kinase
VVERGDLTGALLDGRYRVIEPVAEGAMGVVYRAERVKLGRIVAVKVLHDVLPNELSGRKRFEIEAMAMAKLEHPHCASVLDVGVHNDKPFVVMEFVAGENLKDVIARGPQPIPRATEIVRQVLSGLAHAHEHGIIHRDIKPANIVLSQKTGLGDHVKILDFGLARLHDTGQNLTAGIVVGTPAYMAPEQIRGHALDGRADLYACGVLLFELLTAKKPYHSEKDDPIEVCRMHLSLPIPRLDSKLPGVDFGALEGISARALAKDSDDRYGSAQEMATALDAVPRRPSRSAQPLPRSGPVQLASADVMEVADLSYPPPVEVRTADVMSAIPVDTVTSPAAGGTPDDGDARAVEESAPVPGTFLGITVTPPPLFPARPGSSAGTSASRPGPGSSPGSGPGAARRSRTRRWWVAALAVVLVGGGAAVWLVATSSTPAVERPAATGSQAGDPVGDVVARANDLAARGDRDAALDLIARSRRQLPDSAQLPYTAGRIHFSRFYWTEGLKSFRDALRLDPSYRTDPELIKTVLRGFITTPSYHDDLAAFLRDDIGAAAQPFLEETARDHPNPVIRSRAATELRRYR